MAEASGQASAEVALSQSDRTRSISATPMLAAGLVVMVPAAAIEAMQVAGSPVSGAASVRVALFSAV